MPTYILNNQDRVSIGRLPLRVSAAIQAGPNQVRLLARRGDRTDPSAIHPTPTLMILPAVTERTVVRVEPAPGGDGVFPQGTVVSVSLQTDASGAESEMVHLQPVDVSGLGHRDVAEVEVQDERRLSVAALDVVRDSPLPELAAAARAEARSVLREGRVPGDQAVDVIVGIDTSASMASPVADGSVGALLEVLVGVSHVIGRDRRVDVGILGDATRWLPDVAAEELAATAAREIVAGGWGCGFRSACADTTRPHAQPSLTYVVTDGWPCDADRLAVAHRPRDDLRHVVMITRGRSGGNGRSLPHTRFEPPEAPRRAEEQLLGSRHLLGSLVASLLDGYRPGVADGRPR